MFEVIPQILDRDRTIYQSDVEVKKDAVIYCIRLDKINDVEYYFTFSYINRDMADYIASKLWYDRKDFKQDVNRTDNPQTTLISGRTLSDPF